MGFAVRSSGGDELVENGEINVTPFIDVILVLLIIFMVAAPLSTVDIPVDLPAASAPPPTKPDKPVYVTIASDLSLTVGEEASDWKKLGDAIDAAATRNRDARIFIRADKIVPYGEVIRLFNELRLNGYLKVSMVAVDQGGSTRPPAGDAQP